MIGDRADRGGGQVSGQDGKGFSTAARVVADTGNGHIRGAGIHIVGIDHDVVLVLHQRIVSVLQSEDGFLFVKGRVKRMITRFDGHKVFPVNIESLVAENENVHNCCAIGVTDRDRSQGHYPLVLVELKVGVDEEKVCVEIFRECNHLLEERGRPVGVIAIDEIPLTGQGKNDFKTLEEQYENYNYKTLRVHG